MYGVNMTKEREFGYEQDVLCKRKYGQRVGSA